MKSQEKNTSAEQKFKDTPAGKIPVDWDVTTFKESFDFLRTANNSRADLNDNGPVGYLHYGDIHTKWRTILKCDQEVFPKVTKTIAAGIPTLQNGDLVMADASEDYEGVGVSVEISSIGKQQIISGLHTILLRDKGNRFADGFRGYIQYIPAVRQRMIKVATGVSVYSISKGQLYDVAIPRPPLKEQEKIYKILSSVDEAIRKTQQIIEQAQALKKSLMQSLFTHGLPCKHKNFKKTKIGELPAAWEVVCVGDICSHIGSGVTPRGGQKVYTASGIRFLRSQNITFEGLKLADVAYIPITTHAQMKRSQVLPFDVLLNITGASIGRCCVYPDNLGKANVNQHVCIIRLTDPTKNDACFLAQVLSSRIGQKQIDALNAGGNREGLNYAQVRHFLLPWPPREERTTILNLLASADNTADISASHLKETLMLKAALVQVLLTGKVRV